MATSKTRIPYNRIQDCVDSGGGCVGVVSLPVEVVDSVVSLPVEVINSKYGDALHCAASVSVFYTGIYRLCCRGQQLFHIVIYTR